MAVEDEIRAMREQIAQLTAEVHRLAGRLAPQLVDVSTAARALGVCEKTIRRKVKTREIPSRRIGGALRIDISQMQAIGEAEIADLVDRHRAA